MKIEFLYFEGCASYKPALERLQKLLVDHKIESAIEMTAVESQQMAKTFKFPGSPTIRINGEDVDPHLESTLDKEYSRKCRVYNDNGALKGVPPVAWINSAIERGKGR